MIFKQDETSKQFFETGSPWLNRFLPFWSAHQMNRLLLSVLPVLVIVLPLLKAAMVFKERRNRAAIMRLLIDAKELQFGHLQRDGHADDQNCLDLYPLKQRLHQLDPLTVHLGRLLPDSRGAGRRTGRAPCHAALAGRQAAEHRDG